MHGRPGIALLVLGTKLGPTGINCGLSPHKVEVQLSIKSVPRWGIS